MFSETARKKRQSGEGIKLIQPSRLKREQKFEVFSLYFWEFPL
jgi:hypothetical protein